MRDPGTFRASISWDRTGMPGCNASGFAMDPRGPRLELFVYLASSSSVIVAELRYAFGLLSRNFISGALRVSIATALIRIDLNVHSPVPSPK